MPGPVLLDVARQCANVGGVVMVVVDKAQLGQGAHPRSPAVHGIKQAGGGGRRVLWVGWQHQHPGHALGLESVQLFGDRGLAVAHGVAHRYFVTCLGEPALQAQGLFFCPDLEGRALRRPDAGVFGRRLGRPHAQNNAVQNQQPEQAGNFHHAGIAQKFGQKTPHVGCCGARRSAQVAKQHSGSWSLPVTEARLLSKGGGLFLGHAVFSLTYA